MPSEEYDGGFVAQAPSPPACSTPVERTFELGHPLDLRMTLLTQRMGNADPTAQWRGEESCHALRTPEGPGAIGFAVARRTLRVRAFGPGARWLVERAASMAGLEDDPDSFTPADRPMCDLVHRTQGVRLSRAPVIIYTAIRYVLEQRVTFGEAVYAWKGIVQAHAETAPGPWELVLPPDLAALMKTPDALFMQKGVESRRAATIRELAAGARFLDRVTAANELGKKLRTIPGIGPWTEAMVLGAGLGEPDVVPVLDVNLPHLVTWALAAEPRGTDERMLELLAPYAGHRFRVIRLIHCAGVSVPKPRVRRARHRYRA